MHDIWHAIILALIQGITEFLPVSSSAHLILVPKVLRWADQGLYFDVAIHMGTLIAVLLYFRAELRQISTAWWRNINGGPLVSDAKLAWAIGFGTVPVGIVGLLLHDQVSVYARDVHLIALNTIIFGLFLGLASAYAKERRDEFTLRWWDVVLIGCAQALALMPGVSRSGITLTAGLMLGLQRGAAARYSFLLSIPVILLAGALEIWHVIHHVREIDYPSLTIAMFVAAASGYACISWFLQLITRIGLAPFVVYRVVLGALLLAISYS